MIKKIVKILRKIIFSCLILYGYNIIMVSMNMMVPINIITVGSLSIIGMPALFAFISILYFIY